MNTNSFSVAAASYPATATTPLRLVFDWKTFSDFEVLKIFGCKSRLTSDSVMSFCSNADVVGL